MVILDTNVVSELMKAAPEPAVERWLAEQPAASVFICAITEAELRHGVALMPDGRRRATLSAAVAEMLEIDFGGRILPFDSPAAIAFAQIAAERRLPVDPSLNWTPRSPPSLDPRAAAMATRNVGDFEGCGVEVINPWRTRG